MKDPRRIDWTYLHLKRQLPRITFQRDVTRILERITKVLFCLERSERTQVYPSVRADKTTLHNQCARIAVLEPEGVSAHTDGPKTGQAYSINGRN